MTVYGPKDPIPVTASIPSGYSGYDFKIDHVLKVAGTVRATANGVNPGSYTFTDGLSITSSGALTHESRVSQYTTAGGTVIPASDWVVSSGTHSYQYNAPVAVAGSNSSVNQLTNVAFDGSASTPSAYLVSYVWTFTDITAKSLTGISPNYTFNNVGVIPVTLTVTDTIGATATSIRTITVVDSINPIAVAGSNQTVTRSALVTFNGSGSHDNSGGIGSGIASYEWTFTYDGEVRTLTGVAPTYRFHLPSTYTVSLIVTDNVGRASTASTMTVTVNAEIQFGDIFIGKARYDTIGAANTGAVNGNVISLMPNRVYNEQPTISKAVTVTSADGLEFKTNADTFPTNLTFAGDFTICATLKPKRSNTAGSGYYNMYMGTTTNTRFLAVVAGSAGTDSQFEIEVESGQRCRWNIPTYVDIEKEYVVTRESGILRLYVDGVEITSVASGSTNRTGTLNITRIGSCYSTSYWYDGKIKNIQFFDRALSLAEINYNRGRVLNGTEHGLVAWYPLIHGEGTTAIDCSANTNNGTITGATWVKSVSPAQQNRLNFNGSNSYIQIAHNATVACESEVTILASFNTTVSHRGTIVSKHHTNYCTAIDSATKYNVWFGDGTNYSGGIMNTGAMNDGNDHTFSLVLNKSTGEHKWWLDNNYIGAVTTTPRVGGDTKTLYIGSRTGNTNLFNGKLWNIRLYNRVLNDDEINASNNGVLITNGLVGYWPLNEGFGTIAYDESGNNNNGTIVNGAWETQANVPIIRGNGTADVITVSNSGADIKDLRIRNAGSGFSGVKFI